MITPFNIFVIGGGGFMIPFEYKTYELMVYRIPHELTLVMTMMMMMVVVMMMMTTTMMIVSVEQRPGWTE